MFRSLRARLTVLYLALFSLLFISFSAFLYVEVSRALLARFDQTLASELDTAAGIFPDEFQEMKGDAQLAAREVVSEMKFHGDRVTVREGDRTLASGGSGQLSSKDVRIASRIVEAGGRKFEIEIRASMDSIDDYLAVVLRVISFGLPLVLSLAGVGGYFLAKRSLRPLHGIAEQARSITGNNLESRIHIEESTDEVAILAESFNELLSRLDHAFGTMRRFIADASHELRTPVSVILGEADVALTRERGREEYHASLVLILDEARKFSRLVDDLLNLTRADAGGVTLRRDDLYLNDLLLECCQMAQGMASVRQVHLECRAGVDLPFTGDETWLRRLLMNLLENALRYTQPGGTVVAAIQADSARIDLSVSDNGIGIAEKDRPHIFERFYRADDARSRQNGGVGLGLAIVKWVAEAHAGVVTCSTELDKGSCFTVSLPR